MPTKDYTLSGREEIQVDPGLRAYLLQVYNYMAVAFVITGIAAMLTVTSPTVMAFLYRQTPTGEIGYTGFGWIVVIAPLIFVLVLSWGMQRISIPTAQAVFWIFAVVMGLSLSSIFLVYTHTSVARVFFITSAVFGAMSLYGYTTKRDLSSWGSFLMMGLIGIVIASLVNLFIASSALYFATSVIGVLIFVGLTAYDTQRIKAVYYHTSEVEANTTKIAILGALSLYLDFINLFLLMLRFFGGQRK